MRPLKSRLHEVVMCRIRRRNGLETVMKGPRTIVERTKTFEEKTVEPGRAGGSSAWLGMSSAPGRAQVWPGRAPPGPDSAWLVQRCLLLLLDDFLVPHLFDALCVMILPM